ncbi:MAG: hypothetical protein ACRDHX_15245, partial [Chloroflexota bacterium]
DRHAWWLGLALGVSVQGKSTAYVLVPVYLLFLLHQGWRRRSLLTALLWLGQCLVAFAIVVGWWLGRDSATAALMGQLGGRVPATLAKHVPLMALPVLATLGAIGVALALFWLAGQAAQRFSPTRLGQGLLALVLVGGVAFTLLPASQRNGRLVSLHLIFQTFVASFGTGVVEAPGWTYALAGVVAGVCSLLLLLRLFGFADLAISRRAAGALGLLTVAAAILPLGRSIILLDMFLLHGRFLMIGLAPLALLVAGAVAGPLGCWRAGAGVAFSAGFAAVGLAMPFVAIGPAYAAAPTISAQQFAAVPHHPLSVDFGTSFRLVGESASASSVDPGGTVTVTLYWQPLTRTDANWEVGVHLLDPTGRIAYAGDQNNPGNGARPTSTWRPGALIVDRYALAVSPKAPPQTLLRIGVSMFQRGGPALRYLDYRLAGGNSGVTYVFGAIRVGGQAAVPNIAFAPSNLRFGAGIELLSVSPADTIWSPGDALRVVLQWKALAPVSRRYTVFVHLLDSANKVVAQSDAQPRGNTYPTTLWQPGETIVDTHLLLVPPAFQGPGRLEVGLYDSATQQRLPLANGQSSAIVGLIASK